jgi:hypothetical protein
LFRTPARGKIDNSHRHSSFSSRVVRAWRPARRRRTTSTRKPPTPAWPLLFHPVLNLSPHPFSSRSFRVPCPASSSRSDLERGGGYGDNTASSRGRRRPTPPQPLGMTPVNPQPSACRYVLLLPFGQAHGPSSPSVMGTGRGCIDLFSPLLSSFNLLLIYLHGVEEKVKAWEKSR